MAVFSSPISSTSFSPMRLPAGEDPPVGDASATPSSSRWRRSFTRSAEPGVGVLHQHLQRGARLRTGRLEAVGRGLQRRRFHLLDLDADRLQQLGDVGKLEQHADRADQRGLLGDDVVGGQRGDVAAGGGQALRPPPPAASSPSAASANRRAARSRRWCRRGELMWTMTAGADDVLQPLQRLDAVLVAADQAFDVDAGDVRCARSGRRGPPAWRRRRRPRPPRWRPRPRATRQKVSLRRMPAAVDDHIGFEATSIFSWRPPSGSRRVMSGYRRADRIASNVDIDCDAPISQQNRGQARGQPAAGPRRDNR